MFLTSMEVCALAVPNVLSGNIFLSKAAYGFLHNIDNIRLILSNCRIAYVLETK